ncbi:MAG: LysM peptidoglycan-binding domain-containing protein [Bacteroidia bacterium]|nr:LysM peptidoglycan-binding domain-containing protein [Bacteroidia bacterium]
MRFLSLALFLLIGAFARGQAYDIKNRISKLTSVVELSYNDHVQHAIEEYLANKNGHTEDILGKSGTILTVIEDSLDMHGLPVELQFLVPALSDYDVWKVSDDGGSGYWQLRYLIAKRYGLKISSYVDERRDYHKATSAAIPYLKHLYEVFGDWHSVIAAFVADEVEVNKAIRMAGGDSSYWAYHSHLPSRYQSIVPRYIASVYMHSYYESHQLRPSNQVNGDWEKVAVTEWLSMYQLSKALETNYDALKNANAIYKKQVVPNTDKTYWVKIPFEKVGRFNELGDSIYRVDSHPKDSTEPKQVKKDEPKVEEPAVVKPPVNNGNRLIYYTVRRGDYLGRIADLYDVRISDVKKWNKLRSDRINVNQRLKIYKPASKYAKYNKINSMSASQKNQLIKQD